MTESSSEHSPLKKYAALFGSHSASISRQKHSAYRALEPFASRRSIIHFSSSASFLHPLSAGGFQRNCAALSHSFRTVRKYSNRYELSDIMFLHWYSFS